MPKKKPLPNTHANSGEMATVLRNDYPAAWRRFPEFREPILSRQVVTALAERHHFPTNYDLEKPLDDALTQYFYVYARDKAGLKYARQKSYLQEVIERSRQLRECLDKMSGDMEHGIYVQWHDIYSRADTEPPSKYRWRRRMLEDSQRLTAAARRALRAMPAYTPAVREFHTLMDQLVEIFESANQKPVTRITKVPDADVEYSAPIVKFVEECLEAAGIKKTNSAVGQALARAIKRKLPRHSST